MKTHMRAAERKNLKTVAEVWTDLVNWERRALTEGPFLLEQLRARGCKRVFDGAFGDGFTSLFLIKNGFEVVSNELSPEFHKVAMRNAKAHGIKLRRTMFNWQDLHKHIAEGSFDALILNGNSFGCEASGEIREKAIFNFHHILVKGGIIEIDEANDPYMLREAGKILNGHFRYSGNFIYCGVDKVSRIPIKITSEEVIMQYTHIQKRKVCQLRMYPFKKGEIASLMQIAGFSNIQTFSDFKPGYNPDADFYMHVAVK